MSGVFIQAGFDSSAITHHLAMLAIMDARGFDGVRREIGEYMKGDIQDNFDHQKLFDGRPMPQSAASRGRKGGYVKSKSGRWYYSKKASVGRTLIDSGRLRNEYTYNLVGAGVEIGSPLVYAAIHHFGGETGRTGHRFTLPARPVMGIGPEQERRIGEFLIKEIQGAQR